MATIVNINASEPSTGIFVTPKTIVTFPVASTVITMVWKMTGQLIPQWAGDRWIVVLISFIFGMFITAMSDIPGDTWKDYAVAYFCAIINSIFLAATSLGIVSVV